MRSSPFIHQAADGMAIHVRHWLPETKPTAIILVAHGMAEHAARYERLATALTQAGLEVYAPDHRGHGQTGLASSSLGYFGDSGGMRRVVEDLHELSAFAQAQGPGLPVYLLGHSMGSFISQYYISLFGAELAGCILSGTAGPMPAGLLAGGSLVANLGSIFKGRRAGAPLANKLSFGSYNDAFKPNRTAFDWLSRDNAEVDKYIADPLCGFLCSYGFFRDLMGAFRAIHSPEALAAIPPNLPIYLVAGAADPVGAARGSVDALAELYKGLGIKDVEEKLYEGARHEILNETNRDEVTKDILDWLRRHRT